MLDAYEHQSYTYGTLVRKLAIPRNPSRLPLIEVQFNLERVGDKLRVPRIGGAGGPEPQALREFRSVPERGGAPAGLTMYCDYNTDLLDEATIARWLEHYRTLLLGIAADPEQPVAGLPLLSDGGPRRTDRGVEQSTAAAYPADKCVHQMVDEQAARSPRAWRCSFRGEGLTYGSLTGVRINWRRGC